MMVLEGVPDPSNPTGGVDRESANRDLATILRWGACVGFWIVSGFPRRSKEEVKLIYDTKCRPCDYNQNDRCSMCGCGVSENRITIWNKIRMATEHCLKGLW